MRGEWRPSPWAHGLSRSPKRQEAELRVTFPVIHLDARRPAMDVEAEAARDRRQIRIAVLSTVAGTTVLVALGTWLGLAVIGAPTRCPAPPAGITLPR